MKQDLRGRVANTKLPHSKPLAPLFEAVVNALQSITEAGVTEGSVDVLVERDENQKDFGEIALASVTSFVITDNGGGFTDESLRSFETADSMAKRAIGSKGVGRFLWLKAFGSVRIDSFFPTGGKMRHRGFDFVLSESGIERAVFDDAPDQAQHTTVKLDGFFREYQAHCPKGLEVIGLKLIGHCLEYFVQPGCPTITLRDRVESLNLNDLFASRLRLDAKPRSFAVKGHDLSILHLRLYSADEPSHTLRYCANRREVLEERLAGSIPDLTKKLRDEEGVSFVVSSYVTGGILDEEVNAERTGFAFSEPAPDLLPSEVTFADIRAAAVEQVREHLAPLLSVVAQEKVEQITQYVQSKAPQYRALLKHHPESLSAIPPGLSEEKLDVALHVAQGRAQEELRQRCERIATGPTGDIRDTKKFRQEFDDAVVQLNDFGKARLAEYIVHRRLALHLLSRSLERDEQDRYSFEASVHEIIFPLRRTSDDIDFENQNLWIIDEKLSYHRYLASDKLLKSLEPIGVASADRPDLIVFNGPFAFVEEGTAFSSVVIVEFKRPVRDDYDESSNPIDQVYEYVRKISSGTAFDKRGRPIPVGSSTRYYAYVICDMTPTLRRQAENFSLTKTPDERGYFGFNPNLRAYIEVISFEKLVHDAEARNRVLFDKLFGRR